VESRLGRRVFVERDNADVILAVALERRGDTWLAELELLDTKRATLGTRHVQSKSRDCRALKDVLPVVIALLVDTSQLSVRLELPPPTYEPPLPETSLARANSPPTTPASSSLDRSSHWGWTALGEATHALMPGFAAGASLVAFFEPARTRARLELWLGAVPSTISEQNLGLRLSLIHGGVSVCPSLWRKATHASICAGVGVGSLQVSGRGFDINRSDSSLHVEARASGQLDVPIARPWFARMEAGAILPWVRTRFEGEAEPGARSTLHRPAAVIPRVAVGVGVGFE
jgi:hypothetical protein